MKASGLSFCLLLCLIFALIGILHYFVGYEAGSFVFYLLPIYLASKYGSLSFGIVSGVISILTWGALDAFLVPVFDLELLLWRMAARFLVFLLFSFGIWIIRRREEKERDLIDFIIHDLRDPLSAIDGYLKLIRTKVDGKIAPKEVDLVDRCQIACSRMKTLVNSILDLSRLESSIMPVRTDRVDIPVLVNAVIKEVSVFAERDKVNLEELCESGASCISTDRELLFRMLVNLLSNAIKVSAHGDTVTLHVSETTPGYVNFDVKDHGPGISPLDQKKLFVKFSQLDLWGKEIHKGSGMGLAFVRSAAKALGGGVTVESFPGEGTIFKLKLPTYSLGIRGR